MTESLIFYDIIYRHGERVCISHNTAKIRLVLNYKKIAYKTVWADFADVGMLSKQIGASPTRKRRNGDDAYTFPAIQIPSTGRTIAGSEEIFKYLEQTYPDRPLGLQNLDQYLAVEQDAYKYLLPGFVPVIAQVTYHMTPRNVAAFTSVLQDFTGSATIPHLAEEHISALRSGLSELVKRYNGHKYLFGTHLSYADFLLGSFIVALNEVLEDARKAELKRWDDGKWGQMLLEYEENGYMETDEGELFIG